MKHNLQKKIIKTVLILLIVSIMLESCIFIYNFLLEKIFKRAHLTENKSIEINVDDMEITDDENNYYLKVGGVNQKIYNISLVMNDKNQDVYMRVIINNDAKFIPKENAEATKFKVYFISGIDTDQFSITFPTSQVDISNIKSIIINDNLDYMPEVNFSILRMLVIYICLLFIYFIVKIYKYSNKNNIKIKKENLFFILATFVGIIFVFINAPQVRYDEHAHFWRAYEIASGNFISKTTNELPSSIINLFRTKEGSYPNRNINYQTIKGKLNDELNKDKTEIFAVGATGSLTPISYIPQVCGVVVGKLLNTSPIIILWAGRLANLLCYIILVFFAIKIMPTEKWKAIIMIIALFPMSLNLASTVSPDTIIIGTTLLAISYALHLKFESTKIKTKQVFILGILCMIPTICKIVYFPLLLLFFILPREKFNGKKSRIFSFICIIITVFIPYLALNKLASLGDWAIAIRSNMTEQILFSFSSITRLLKTGVNTFYSQFSGYLFETIGGWNTLEILSIMILCILLFVTFEIYEENNNYKFSLKDKIWIGIIITIELLGVAAAMYLGWTQAKQMVIEGIQGRYFIPIIPLLFIVISKNKIQSNIKSRGIKFAVVMLVLYLIIFGFSIRSYIA